MLIDSDYHIIRRAFVRWTTFVIIRRNTFPDACQKLAETECAVIHTCPEISLRLLLFRLLVLRRQVFVPLSTRGVRGLAGSGSHQEASAESLCGRKLMKIS